MGNKQTASSSSVQHFRNVQQSYGLGVEAVEESFGPRIGAPVLLAVQLAEKTVYNLGNWSLGQLHGLSSDTTNYIGPGWQEAWPQ